MAKELSVAPKERINVKFVPATGGQQEEIELPMKMVVLGDFSGRASDASVEERKPVSIDKNSFTKVMKEMELSRSFEVANTLAADEPDASMRVDLNFSTLQDFSPDEIVKQVPELTKLVELREALTALKGPLGNMPAFRKALSELVEDSDQRDALLAQIGAAGTDD